MAAKCLPTWRDKKDALQDLVLGDLQDLLGDVNHPPDCGWHPPEIQDPAQKGQPLRACGAKGRYCAGWQRGTADAALVPSVGKAGAF